MLFNLKKIAAIFLCFSVSFIGSSLAMPKVAAEKCAPQRANAAADNELVDKQRVIDEKVVEGVQAELVSQSPVMDIIDASNEVIKIQVNGELIDVSPHPFIENNRTLIPLRGVMEKMGASVEWYAEKSTVEITKDHIRIELVIGEDTAEITRDEDGTVNEETVKLEVPPRIVDDRTFIPVRFVSESLGAQVDWNQSLNMVVIENGEIIAVERPIDFETVEINTLFENETLSKWYEENYMTKGIYQLTDGDWMYVLISAGERPTGGYSLKVESITEVTPGTAYVYAVLDSPDKDSMVIQALTYPHAAVRFSKDNIEKVIWDLADEETVVNGEIKESLAEMGKAISIDSIKEMKLYSLMQEEIKTFTDEEIKELVNKLNTSPTYDGPHIEMLAGNSIAIVLKNDEIIRITSFGSKEHIILSIAGEEHETYCIICPEIAGILLGQESEAEQVIRNLVEDFGAKLQLVSLLAPKDVLEKSMNEHYGTFITPELLEKWITDPQNAPGRLTSSPWPDRIEIESITKLSEDEYEVKGNIVEISSTEKESGGIAAKAPITLTVKRYDERWLIDNCKIAA